MSRTKPLRRVIPVEPGTDVELLRWLTRESFEVYATGELCVIRDYEDRPVPTPTDLTPQVLDALELPPDEYEWREFTALMVQREDRGLQQEVCGYCQHPPHTPGNCGGDCLCLGDTA